jgi:hypothetical protein
MVIIDRAGTVSVDGPPTAEDVATVWQHAGSPTLPAERVADLLAEIDHQAHAPRAAEIDAGGLVRAAAKRGVPIGRGTAGLPGPTARNWLRGLIALCTGGDAVAAIARERSLQLQPAQGLTTNTPTSPTAPAAAPRAPVAPPSEASADDITQVMKLRFPGFPEKPSPAARDAVRRWEAATGQVYPWPETTPLAMKFAHPVPGDGPPAFVVELDAAAGDRSGLDAILADLEATRGELDATRGELDKLRDELNATKCDLAAAREERDATKRELTDVRLGRAAVDSVVQTQAATIVDVVAQGSQAQRDLQKLRAAATHAADLLAGAAADFTPSAKREPQRRLHAAAVDAEQALRDVIATLSPSR